jgi:pimeloyl-ACP methyl ester carboxylesterase
MLRKHDTPVAAGADASIRTRRAYFDVRYGQLHVRTAFPATGGFDEQAPLFCLHDAGASSREFGGFLAAIAARRSVYAPDWPGSGESDPPPEGGAEGSAAAAVLDLVAELRLRRIDLLGVGAGAAVAVEVARLAPERVGRVVAVGAHALVASAATTHPCLVLALDGTRDPPRGVRGQNLEWVVAPEYRDRPFLLAPQALAERVAAFLDRR